MADNSEIVYGKGGTTFVGTDAINFLSAINVAGYLELYANHGIRPTRRIGPTDLLKMATSFTKKTYKRGEYLQAAADVREWARAMKAALPKTDSDTGEALP